MYVLWYRQADEEWTRGPTTPNKKLPDNLKCLQESEGRGFEIFWECLVEKDVQ